MASKAEKEEMKRTESYLLGVSSGWDEAAKWVKERSVVAFAADKMDDAMRLKMLAAEMAEESKKARQKFENFKKHGSTLDASELDE